MKSALHHQIKWLCKSLKALEAKEDDKENEEDEDEEDEDGDEEPGAEDETSMFSIQVVCSGGKWCWYIFQSDGDVMWFLGY